MAPRAGCSVAEKAAVCLHAAVWPGCPQGVRGSHRGLLRLCARRAVYECVRAQVTGTQGAARPAGSVAGRASPRHPQQQQLPHSALATAPSKSLLDSLSKWKWSA